MASVRIRRRVRRCERTTSYLITCISGASHTLAYPIIKWLAVLVRRLEAVAWKALMKLSVEGVESKWPWKTALGKFDSVTPGKKIWFVHPKKHLPSVLLLRLTRADSVNFKYRGASNDRVSVDFSAGDRFLSDIPVTASDYSKEPEVLNRRFVERAKSSQHWFLLGLARAERRGPDGYNRLDAWLWLVEDGYKFDGQLLNCFAAYRFVGNGCILSFGSLRKNALSIRSGCWMWRLCRSTARSCSLGSCLALKVVCATRLTDLTTRWLAAGHAGPSTRCLARMLWGAA